MFLYYYFQCCPTTMLLCILEKCLWTVSFHINPLHLFFVSDAFLSLSLPLSPFFSCFPTSTLKFPPSRSVITILICRRILFVPFPPSFFFSFSFFWSTSAHILRMLNGFLKGTRVHVRPTFWVSFDYHPLAQQMLAIKVRKPFFSVSLPERTCDPYFFLLLLLFLFSSLSFPNPPIDFPRDWWSSQPTLIYFSLPPHREIDEILSPKGKNFENETSNENRVFLRPCLRMNQFVEKTE